MRTTASTFLLVGALVVSALAAPPAEARWRTVERARAVAVAYWGEWPPNCPWVWSRRGDLPDDFHGWAVPGKCTIWIDRGWYAAVGRWPVAWPRFCALFVHEWGHMIGRSHSTDPASVMYPTVTDGQPAGCAERTP